MELCRDNIEDVKFIMSINPLPYHWFTIDGVDVVIPNKYGSDWIRKATIDDLKRVAVR